MNWLTILDNREWATLIWLTILIVWASFNNQIRASFRSIIKALLAKRIIILLSLMASYVVLLVFGLSYLGLWDISQLKNTLIWSVTVGIVTMFSINRIQKEEHYFRKAALENLKIGVFIEYLVTLYVFSLPVELVLVPFISLLVLLLAVAQTNEQYKPAEKLLNGLLFVLGVGLLAFSIYSIYNDFNGFVTVNNVIAFFLPIVLSILFLPFIYVERVYIKYEDVFIRLRFLIKDPALRKYAQWRVALHCRLDLKMLDRFSQNLKRERPKNQKEVVDLLNRSRSLAVETTSEQLS
jgi:hypothetical protein